MKISGYDLSHWNEDSQFRSLITNDAPFFILKATEGRSYVDAKFRTRATEIIKKGSGLGLYHYARPEKNTARGEAEHFIRTVRDFSERAIYALDWEGVAEKYGVEWILEWCEKVEQELGKKPMLYLNYAYAKTADTALADYPLWCAKWGQEPTGSIGMWSEYTIWQFTNKPYDSNVFNGSIEDFRKIGSSNEPAEEIGHYCGCCCCRK